MKRDKIYHIIGGVIASIVILVLIYVPAPVMFIVLLLTVALGKEYIYDANVPGHTVDIWDAVATIAGGVLIGLVFLFVRGLG
jgi:uncharacterized membrane protein AbrB (regulator of aidB expression)